MHGLYLKTAPPLDPAWLQYEADTGIAKPKPALPAVQRQPLYAAECRALTAKMTAPGARDHRLSQGITATAFTVPSTVDGVAIPVIQYSPSTLSTAHDEASPTTTVIYLHGGGLVLGEADSEELSCRRIVADSGLPSVSVYSVGYRLMPSYPAKTCVSDCLDAFEGIIARAATAKSKVLLVGSSSGGELAALLAGKVGRSRLHGVALRCPVTSDGFTDLEKYVPERFRGLHTSTLDDSFVNCLLGKFRRDNPRDGLEYMPLEAPEEELRATPRTWVQVCSNDGLYSDGVCYARALDEVCVEVRVDVVWGWPHTFWLKAPELQRALEAEEEMLKALRWLAE